MNSGNEMLLSDKILSPTLSVSLPFNKNLTLSASVFDSLGAKTMTFLSFAPIPLPSAAVSDPIGFAANLSSTLLQNALSTQDTQQTLTVLSVLTNILNSNPSSSTNGGTTTSVTETQIRQQILDTIGTIAANLTSSSGATQVISLLVQVTANPGAVSPNGFQQTIDILTNVISTQNTQARNDLQRQNTGTSSVDDSTGTITTQATQVASNILNSGNCSSLAAVQDLMRQVLQLEMQGRVAGEEASTLNSDAVRAVVQRAFQSSALGASANSTSTTSFLFPSFSLNSSQPWDLSVVTYANLSQCLNSVPNQYQDRCGNWVTSPASTVVSDLTTAEVTDSNGTVRDVNGLASSSAINFTLPVSVSTGARVRCKWFDEVNYVWSEVGCTTTYDPVNDPTRVHCSCTHLTDFAVLLNEAESREGHDSAPVDECNPSVPWSIDRLANSITYRAFAVLYGVMVLLALYPLVRALRDTGTASRSLSLACHGLVVAICGLRLISMMIYIFSSSASYSLVVVLAGLPYMFMFALYSFLIFAWAGIYHYATSSIGDNPFNRMKSSFAAVNGVAISGCAVLFGIMAFDSGNAAMLRLISLVGSIAIGSMSLLMGLGFIAYGSLLCYNLTNDFPSRHARKIFVVAVICSCSFIVESIMIMLSIGEPAKFQQNFTALNSLYLGADVICMLAVLVLFKTDSNRNRPRTSFLTPLHCSFLSRSHSTFLPQSR